MPCMKTCHTKYTYIYLRTYTVRVHGTIPHCVLEHPRLSLPFDRQAAKLAKIYPILKVPVKLRPQHHNQSSSNFSRKWT